MTQEPPRDGPGPETDATALYLEYKPFLLYLAGKKFHIPAPDAEGVVHDVFVSYLEQRTRIRTLRPWLIWATVHASQDYWRRRRGTEPFSSEQEDRPDEATVRQTARIEESFSVREVFGHVRTRCRELLIHRFLEGFTIAEIAAQQSITAKYAKKLVFGCVTKLRRLYRKGTKVL